MKPAPPISHPADVRWAVLTAQIGQRLKHRSADASRALVLVPYAQLMDAGRRAWAQVHPNGFSPRFESSRNWAATLQPFMPSPNDLSGDVARDSLVAANLVDRVGRGRVEPALRSVLVTRLVEAARQLAPLAAARPSEARADWAAAMREAMATGGQALQWESLVASLALAWTSASAYPTDVLWTSLAAPGVAFDELLVLQGFQPDPLATALAALWGDRVTVLSLHSPSDDLPMASLHACRDAQDEAQRAAACVIAQANAGRTPVALVANDRLLVRQVSAQLHGAGMTVRDETGWKLSTTHAAARLMSLLRATDPRARTDDLLDFLQQTRVWPEVQLQSLGRRTRALGLAQAASALRHPQIVGSVPADLPELIAALQAPRPLSQWLPDLAQTLRICGWWEEWSADAAGQQIVQTLRLSDGAAHEIALLEQGLQDETAEATRRRTPRMSLAAFTDWVRDALEGASFMAPHTGTPDVVILPMAQLLGRSFAATVVPGCDERHLPSSPEPPGAWSLQERLALGLPDREALAEATRQTWGMLTRLPEVDLLWRTQEQGEAVLPSPWVLMLTGSQDAAALAATPEPRERRTLTPEAVVQPGPSAGDLLPEALSASAYQDLRDCPYRFFALRQLRLQDADELEVEPDKRDMGIWLHAVLKVFHEERAQAQSAGAAPDARGDRERIDRLARTTAEGMGLNALSAADDATEGRAGFLPFQAAWPAVRDGYLDWLWKFEASGDRAGPRFAQAELSLRSEAGPYRLIGTLDRVDHQDSPEGVIPFVIDYKTEPRDTTRNRVKAPLEDTQIAYYAALLPEETVRAAYLSVTESRDANATQLVEQTQVIAARDALREGLVRDLDRVAAGHGMPALGEGKVCDFCAARGLCRKDFWTAT
jgi:ATP-dependent helicase/nuclease subunit B